MQRLTTTIAGPLFWIGLAVAAVFIMASLFTIWNNYAKAFTLAREADAPAPPWQRPLILTVLLVGSLVMVSTVVWNAMQSLTTNASNYTTKEEAGYRETAMKTNLPTNEQLDQTKADLKNRAEVQPHQKTLDDFDAKMAAEHAKIIERSLNGTNRTNTEKQ